MRDSAALRLCERMQISRQDAEPQSHAEKERCCEFLRAAAGEPEMLGRRKHMPVVGPNLGFAGFQSADELDGIARAQKNVGGECDNQGVHSPYQCSGDRHERPQLTVYMRKKLARERSELPVAKSALAQVSVKDAGNLGDRPGRGD